jgi:hypothetical protein
MPKTSWGIGNIFSSVMGPFLDTPIDQAAISRMNETLGGVVAITKFEQVRCKSDSKSMSELLREVPSKEEVLAAIRELGISEANLVQKIAHAPVEAGLGSRQTGAAGPTATTPKASGQALQLIAGAGPVQGLGAGPHDHEGYCCRHKSTDVKLTGPVGVNVKISLTIGAVTAEVEVSFAGKAYLLGDLGGLRACPGHCVEDWVEGTAFVEFSLKFSASVEMAKAMKKKGLPAPGGEGSISLDYSMVAFDFKHSPGDGDVPPVI